MPLSAGGAYHRSMTPTYLVVAMVVAAASAGAAVVVRGRVQAAFAFVAGLVFGPVGLVCVVLLSIRQELEAQRATQRAMTPAARDALAQLAQADAINRPTP